MSATASDARRLRDAIRALVRRFAISERADVACCGMTVAALVTGNPVIVKSSSLQQVKNFHDSWSHDAEDQLRDWIDPDDPL